MGFAGTISFKAETLKRIILDTVESLAHHGIGKILILNGHGGNAEVVGYAARLANRRYEAKVLTSNAWSSGTSLGEMVEYVDKHAGAKETEVAQILFGELVEMDRVEDYEPTAEFPPPVEELRDPDATDLELRAQLVMAYIDDTHEFSPSGIYSFEGAGPNEARPENAEEYLEESVQRFVRLIDYWKTID
jgi:creatinine amidohydrolase/Fe(II)-dependent formamide hydrolase-like protein